MGKKKPAGYPSATEPTTPPAPPGKPSALLDTRVIYRGADLRQGGPEQLEMLPDQCVDLIYIDPVFEEVEQSFNSNRTVEQMGEVFWRETKEKRAFEDRHASTQTYIDYMRPRCVQLARAQEDR